jgi:hypothetical protein
MAKDKRIQNAVTHHAQADMANIPAASLEPQTADPQPAQSRGSGAPTTESVLWAEWRRGLKDLQNAVLHAFPQGHVAQHEEPGTIANPTALEVYQEKHQETSAQEVFGRETSYTEQLNQAQSRRHEDRQRGGMTR